MMLCFIPFVFHTFFVPKICLILIPHNFLLYSLEDGMINGLNVADLYRQRIELAIKEDLVVDREIEFVDSVVVGHLTVQGTVNGLKISKDVVLRNTDSPISNKHFAEHVVVDSLIVDGDIQVVNFAGIDLAKFYHDRITLSGDQDIFGDMQLAGPVSASRVSVTGLVNGMNIGDFVKNVMLKNKPHQVVTAAKEFSSKYELFFF